MYVPVCLIYYSHYNYYSVCFFDSQTGSINTECFWPIIWPQRLNLALILMEAAWQSGTKLNARTQTLFGLNQLVAFTIEYTFILIAQALFLAAIKQQLLCRDDGSTCYNGICWLCCKASVVAYLWSEHLINKNRSYSGWRVCHMHYQDLKRT